MDQASAALIAHWDRQRRTHPAYQGWVWNGTIPLDEAARKGIILRRIDRWREAVEIQHERLTKAGDRHVPDLHFYVIAVDNVADAVKVILGQYPELPALQAAVQQALERFLSAAPDVHDLRNLIEHFEEYDHMVGRLQKSGELPRQRMGQFENYALLDGDAQLVIFGKSMMVSKTTPAAQQLAAKVLALKDLLPG